VCVYVCVCVCVTLGASMFLETNVKSVCMCTCVRAWMGVSVCLCVCACVVCVRVYTCREILPRIEAIDPKRFLHLKVCCSVLQYVAVLCSIESATCQGVLQCFVA